MTKKSSNESPEAVEQYDIDDLHESFQIKLQDQSPSVISQIDEVLDEEYSDKEDDDAGPACYIEGSFSFKELNLPPSVEKDERAVDQTKFKILIANDD